MTRQRDRYGKILIVLMAVVTVCAFFLSDRIPQDIRYHNFSDQRIYLSIPNALNVLSNLPFVIVGCAGLIALLRKKSNTLKIVELNFAAYFVLFWGAALVGLGSGYYHLWPNNETLVWDRLPMTLAFMALYSVIIGEFISEKWGRRLLVPLLCAGVFSVVYWSFTESRGMGDLRFYAVIQFFPIVTIPIMLLCFKAKFTAISGYWVLIGTYIAAKLFEHFDMLVYQALVFVSGHSIKHILPAIGLYFLLKTYSVRTRIK